jgi:hypothetical protein
MPGAAITLAIAFRKHEPSTVSLVLEHALLNEVLRFLSLCVFPGTRCARCSRRSLRASTQ